jgi:hypothetical protein
MPSEGGRQIVSNNAHTTSVLTEWPVAIRHGCRWSSKCDCTDEGPLGNHNEPHHTTLDFEAEEEDDEYAHCYDLQWVEYQSPMSIRGAYQRPDIDMFKGGETSRRIPQDSPESNRNIRNEVDDT